MKKLYTFGLALAAVFAFGAFVVVPAFAVSQILAGSPGVPITAMLELQTTGEIILHNLTNGAEVLCSGTFDGLVEPGGVQGAINEVLMLDGTLLAENTPNLAGTSVAGDDIECIKVKVCENEPVLVVAWNLPWSTEIILVGTEYRLKFTSEVGYTVECTVLFSKVVLRCSVTNAEAPLLLDANGDLAGEFDEAIGPEASCSDGSTGAVLSDAADNLIEEVPNKELLTLSDV